MGIVQGPEAEEMDQKVLPNNPFVPPKGDSCPINQLPPELLSVIFEVGALEGSVNQDDEDEITARYWNEFGEENQLDKENSDDDVAMTDGDATDDDEGSVMTGSSDAPDNWPPFQILVSHVCKHWRTVALSTPSLWTSIEVSARERPPYERVSILLERSGGLTLDIRIDCEMPDDEEDFESDDGETPELSEGDLKVLFALLIAHVPRWGSISVDVASYEHMYTFLQAISDPSVPPATQLESLQLYHHEEWQEESTAFPKPKLLKHFTLFGGSIPCLKSLALWGVHVDWSQSWLASAPNLLDLELAYHTDDVRPSWAEFAATLRSASKLETLSLCLSGPSGAPAQWTTEDPSSIIPLPKLTDLVLGFHSPSYTIGLLHKLFTPALKSLTLDFDNEDYTDLVTQLAGPATTVEPPSAHEKPYSLLSILESLKISGLPCGDRSVETLYAELKPLKSLNLSMSYLSPAFLDLLCCPCHLPEHGDIWLPRLNVLSVSGAQGDKIREVVQKRKDAGVPLKSLYLEESCEVEDTDVEWLKDNLETFDFFEGSDDEDVVDMVDGIEDADEWSDVD
ncbi:hypothetical protein HYDPIDRAFT_42886 [Hydnomerulius pinastri MD-312]|uniref:F-box domain-containing protein n=1 Tax=Hydnomerulius pinastri MD-312 TaxID=994086 RepID=A0A0C9VT63_9AGAM|nr:hypothetical protein HYDPIDRAFT_42886 [Hydnomerulius pinastri MD-312]